MANIGKPILDTYTVRTKQGTFTKQGREISDVSNNTVKMALNVYVSLFQTMIAASKLLVSNSKWAINYNVYTKLKWSLNNNHCSVLFNSFRTIHMGWCEDGNVHRNIQCLPHTIVHSHKNAHAANTNIVPAIWKTLELNIFR